MVVGSTTNYTSTDIAPSVVDLLVSVVAALIGFGSLIAIVMLFRWLKNR